MQDMNPHFSKSNPNPSYRQKRKKKPANTMMSGQDQVKLGNQTQCRFVSNVTLKEMVTLSLHNLVTVCHDKKI